MDPQPEHEATRGLPLRRSAVGYRPSTYFALSVGGIVSCVAFLAWQLLGRAGDAQTQLIGDLAPVAPIGVGIALALRASALAADKRTAGAWKLIAAAFGAYLAGTLLWAWFELVRHIAPWPSLADIGFLAFYPLLLCGLLRLPGPPRVRGEGVRLALDLTVVSIAGAMAVWYFVVGPTIRAAGAWDFATMLSLAYPIGDLVLVFGAAMLLFRGSTAQAPLVLPLLVAGCAAFVVADTAFAYLSLTGSYGSGDWPDALWMLAWTAMGIGFAQECAARPAEPRPPRAIAARPSHVSVLPYVAVVAAFTLAVTGVWGSVRFPLNGLLVGAAAITVAVVARQATAQRDNVRLMRRLQILATTDTLMQVANRRHFLELADHHLDAMVGDDLCLIMVDVDGFKTINDTYGHGVGDEALAWLAACCRSALPPDAIIGRLGGDEFAALLPGRDLAASLGAAERLVTSVATARRPVAGGPERLSVSIGVASGHGCADVRAFLQRADEALYESKRDGRGRARGFSSPAAAAAG